MSSLTCGVGGASAGGTLTELIAVGAMDAYLIKNPNVTFFRFRYNKHTNFALEAITQSFQSQVAFGSDSQITLNRTGDLVYYMYIDIEIPGIKAHFKEGGTSSIYPESNGCNACSEQDIAAYKLQHPHATSEPTPPCSTLDGFADNTLAGELQQLGINSAVEYPPNPDSDNLWCHWAQAVGQLIVKRASLVIGGQIIDTLYSDYLYMWEELSGKPGKRLKEMIGKADTIDSLVKDSGRKRRLYVPLPFFFTSTSGNALPLVSLQFHGVQIAVEFEQLSKLIVTSGCSGKDSNGQAVSGAIDVTDVQTDAVITSNSLKACLDTTYVYLDIEERDRFATGSFEQLITQVQQMSMTNMGSQARCQLNFNHPIQELMFCIKRQCNMDANNHFNYSGINGLDPVESVCLKLNNLPRFSNRPGPWFRLVQPYQHHTNIPQAYVYCYSFALHPEEPQPSGSCNFSRIDHVDLNLELQEGLKNEQVVVLVYARNWNIMRYRDGLAGAGFSN